MIHPAGVIELCLVILCFIGIWFSISNFNSVKRILIGRPMRTAELHNQNNQLLWYIALPILSADLYSSVAYGPEAGITELARFGNDAKWFILPITISTVLLLTLLITSYIMGVLAYPNGGGSYAIAKDNFKQRWVALIASSSLLVDYILTVAVSISSAVQNMASAYPIIGPYTTVIAFLCVFILLMVNLRGVAESAKVFAWPTFGFMACMLLLVITGLFDETKHGFVQHSTPPFGTVPQGMTILLILRAFSSACSALTGIETISNAVPIFREPRQKNAIQTYIALGTITAVTLLGFAYHLYVRGISPNSNKTMLSQLTETYLGHGIMYQLIIWFTFIVLILAANSTFTGFSQLAAIVAEDGYLPRELANRGDRLGYSNGIIVLAAIASLLIIAFQANTNALIPLYAIGVFLSFTVAQIGLIKRWKREKGSGWKMKLAINTLGGIVTSSVAMIFAVTKFSSGAWIVLFVIPLMIFFSLFIHHHYQDMAHELKIDLKNNRPGMKRVVTIVLVSDLHRIAENTLTYAKSIGREDLLALYVGFDDESIDRMEKRWAQWGNPCRLLTMKSRYRSVLEPVSNLIKLVKEKDENALIQIVVSQFMPKKGWHNLLHNQTSLLIRFWLLRHKDVVVATVPYHLKK